MRGDIRGRGHGTGHQALRGREQVELLGDLYALDREAVPETGTVCFDTLAVRNQVKTRSRREVQLTRKAADPAGMHHSDRDVKIDEVQIKEDRNPHGRGPGDPALYLTADDQAPVGSSVGGAAVPSDGSRGWSDAGCWYMRLNRGSPGLQLSWQAGDAVEVKGLRSRRMCWC